jgi:hypothetical protein
MKKRVWGILAVATLAGMVFAGVASAALVTAGDQILFKSNSQRPSYGGGIFDMYQVKSTGNVFIGYTFCLENNEALSFNTVFNVDSVGPAAFNGGLSGGNPDPISMQTAYLYKQFRWNTLAGFNIANSTNQQGLQEAIWYFEGEVTGISAAAAAYVADANAHATLSDLTTVRVINPSWASNNSTYRNGTPAQSVLYYVPEPGTMGLLSFGMTALAFISRRRSARK